ncbi:hypothetical protein JCM6882_006549 [Rhodosporidiobolus microsporus]
MPHATPTTTTTSLLDTPASPPPPPAIPFADEEWVSLLACYQDGTSALNSTERPVLQPKSLIFEGEGEGEGLADGAWEGAVPGSLAWVKETYRRKGYLPALRSPREDERQQTLRRYSLSPPTKVQAVDDLCAFARDVFDVPAALINLVLEDRIVFLSSSGWSDGEGDPNYPSATYDLPSAICSHAMSKGEDDGCFVIPDLQKDWRFARGPYCQEGKGRVQSFASANVNLPVHVAPGEPPRTVPVGSFCLVDSKPRHLSAKQQEMLKKFAKMAAKEIELVFQRERNALNEARHVFVSDLFRSLLVYPSRVSSTSFEERCNLDGIAQSVQRYSRSDLTVFLDLRNFNSDRSPLSSDTRTSDPVDPALAPSTANRSGTGATSQAPRNPNPKKRTLSSRRDPAVHGLGSIAILDGWCAETISAGVDINEKKAEWTAALNSAAGLDAVSTALKMYHTNRRTTWASSDVETSPLAPLLPGITAHIAIPFFDHDGEPALYVIIGSRERHFAYVDSDEGFAKGVGAILMAAMLQEKIVAADQAKLAFVGSVSHELRTPIFAIAGNLDLVRQLTGPATLEKVSPLLDVAETCLGTLKDVLDDCLEYSKLSSQGVESSPDVVPPLKLTRCNIVELFADVIKSCWSKEKRYAEMMDRKDGDGVAVLLESHLPPDMEAMCDIGGLKRIGINLLGNALKFTSHGSITIRLSEVSAPPSSTTPSLRYIRFQSIDSGKGMTQEFLRDSLFTPFKQADPFAAGAGLGVSLAAQLVARMGGNISFSSGVGVGTTATVIVPVEVVSSPSAPSTPSSPLPFFRNFSDELNSIASGSPSPTFSGATSPPCEPRPLPQAASPSPSFSAPSPLSPVSSPPASFSAVMATHAEEEEDKRRSETLAVGAVEVLGRVKTDRAAVPELDGPLEERAGHDQVRVLVADDNTVARRVLCAFLRSKDITYLEASGGAEAIELFRSHRPNLVWCDIQMPDVDGVAATCEMRRIEEQENRQSARIIAISGLDANHGEHGGLVSSGQVDRWIVKGGSSLRTLTADLLDYAQRLAPPSGSSPPVLAPPSVV